MALLLVMATGSVANAADAPVSLELFTVNNVWMMVATFLVFIMHLGFATLECGLTRAKNTTNILFKNVSIVAIGLLTYTVIGFNLMYPGEDYAGKWFGFAGFWIDAGTTGESSAYNAGYTYWTDFLFQGMFAATAATIISGAVAERVKLGSFLFFVTIYVALCYPLVGMWHWGGGWLQGAWIEATTGAKFYDFAGSTIVHSVGGWGALICAYLLGPRKGRYVNGSIKPILGHNMPLATIGMFLLWLGWFGFNGGSVLSAAAGDTSRVLVTTCLAAAAGIMAAGCISWLVQKKPDLTMILNGALAGLVGITAGADVTTPAAAVIIGAVAGVLVVMSVLFIDRKLKIDDPVGAISVHLVCGIWGTLAVGIFAPDKSIMAQLVGIGAIGVFCLLFAGVLFYILKVTVGVRVSEKEELAGLDIGEHGMEAYAGFQIFINQ
jgi:Amt family ammonium transporter